MNDRIQRAPDSCPGAAGRRIKSAKHSHQGTACHSTQGEDNSGFNSCFATNHDNYITNHPFSVIMTSGKTRTLPPPLHLLLFCYKPPAKVDVCIATSTGSDWRVWMTAMTRLATYITLVNFRSPEESPMSRLPMVTVYEAYGKSVLKLNPASHSSERPKRHSWVPSWPHPSTPPAGSQPQSKSLA